MAGNHFCFSIIQESILSQLIVKADPRIENFNKVKELQAQGISRLRISKTWALVGVQ